MSDRGKKLEDEMLVTHAPAAEKGMAGREDAGRTAAPVAARIDRTSLRRELVGAATEEERRAIIQSIQERFGNDVAEGIVREVRLARLPEETEDGKET
jgi:hypothetical protein